MKISPARIAAFEILRRIESDKAYTSALLPLYEKGLSPADTALSHELVMGTLRHQMWIDRVIGLFTGRKLDPEVRIALRLGIYQLKRLDRVPAYSAINESVNLVQRARKVSAKGLVNAILRRASAESIEFAYTDETERICIEGSHPPWMIERWVKQIGLEDTARLTSANNTPPKAAFRLLSSSEEDSAILSQSRSSRYVEGCYIYDGSMATLISNSSVYLQDEGSQIVGRAVEVPSGGTFLDVCASPGGKTGLIADNSPNITSFAGDVRWSRVRLLKENLQRQGVPGVSILQHDGEMQLPFPEESFDSILVDAPCTGTGTIRHNPEIRYFLSPEDLARLHEKQAKILHNSAELVRPGGLLVYSTCSLEPEENEHVASEFLKNDRRFDVVKPNVHADLLTEDGYARTWPHKHNMDGFFIAAFRRR